MEDDDLTEFERIEPPGESAVTLTEDDAEPQEAANDDRQPEEGVRDPKTGKWTKKHEARGKERRGMRQELETLRTEKSAIQQRLDEMQRGNQTQQQLFATILQRFGQQAQPQTPQPTADDHALDAVEAKMEAELQAIAKDPNRTTAEYRKMERERMRIIGRMEAGGILKQQPQQQTQQQGVPQQYAYRNEMMKSEFPWLESNQEATVAAQAYRRYLMATGKPDTIETDRLACAHVASERGLGGPVRPSARSRAAMAGIPGGGMAPRQNAPRAISMPASVLKGTGLSKQALAAALLAADEE